MAKISGPLLDRIDIHIDVPAVEFKELADRRSGTSSESMREQVTLARTAQDERFRESKTRYNAKMSSRQVREVCELDKPSQLLLQRSVEEMGLSARAHDKVIRVARTIADLEGGEVIKEQHLQEAVNYRMLDRTVLS
jgi:magnesium chelatase family protein